MAHQGTIASSSKAEHSASTVHVQEPGCVGLCPGDMALSLSLSLSPPLNPQVRHEWKKTSSLRAFWHQPDLAACW